MIEMILTVFKLWVLHAIADYSFQPDIMVERKDKEFHFLLAHGLIHAGAVFIILGPLPAGIEFIAHIVVDYLKKKGFIKVNTDQVFHYLCKIAYVVFL